ncbi:hypothetical protein, partial [Pantoea stewartii]|uniref:hypothetical protein n=1 Tax=Pantoea stewartii TaxID=66269 RepID=UPI003703E829
MVIQPCCETSGPVRCSASADFSHKKARQLGQARRGIRVLSGEVGIDIRRHWLAGSNTLQL